MRTVVVEDPASDASVEVIERGLRAFNDRHRADDPQRVFSVLLRDDEGAIVGGCVCIMRWHWLLVEYLWVAENFRGMGFGRALMHAAESWASAHGCTKARLDTASFQARRFYEALGYQVFGIIDDYPPGHSVIYLQKGLNRSAPA